MKELFFLLIALTCSLHIKAQDFDLSQGNLFEGEPYLAIHPDNSQIITVSWIGFQAGTGIVIKTKNSFDAGQTWSTANFNAPETGIGQADPVLKYDSNGNLFLCYIDYDSQNYTEGSVRVRKSTDFGSTWSASVEAINILDCPNQMCIDRPWMEIDTTGGALDGIIYITTVTANQPTIVNPPYHPYLSVSTDNGNTFNTPRFLDTVGFNAGSNIAIPVPIPTIDGDGVFRAIYPSMKQFNLLLDNTIWHRHQTQVLI